MPTRRLRLAVLISGTGRTLKNFIDLIDAGKLSAEIPVVISSAPNASGLQYAEEDGDMDIEIVERSQFESLETFSEANFEICRRYGVHYVILAGYVKFLKIPKDFENRVLNIHPSLIPAFCGHGFYGDIVHSKAIEYGVKISGCTVHFVDLGYDSGPIILQKSVVVKDDDTVATLNQRVFEVECIAYPEAIELLAEGRVTLKGRRVFIRPPENDEFDM